MESSKFYTAEEIEKLKQKVTAYKNLLTTLKLGDSLEDYQFIQNEFEELKKQMLHVDVSREDQDKARPEQIEEDENQNEVKQVSLQLTSLNQMVEEVLSTLNKFVIGEVKKEQVEEITFPHVQEPTKPAKQVNNVISQPSYSQLRSLAGQVIYQKKAEAPEEPKQKEDYLLYPHQQQRHFNHRYFQSTHTQPNNIYNGLYKNLQVKSLSPLHNPIPKHRSNNDNGFRNGLVVPTATPLPSYYEDQKMDALISNDIENKNVHVDKFSGMIQQPSSLAVIPKQAETLPASAATLQIIEQPPTPAATQQPEEQPPVEVVPPQLEEQPPVEVVPPQLEEQPPVEVVPPQPEEQPPVEVAPPQLEEQPPVEVAPPQSEEQLPVEVVPPQLEEQPPVAFVPPQPEEQLPVEVVPLQLEEQPPVAFAPPQSEEQPPVEVVPPQPEEQPLVSATPSQTEEQPPVTVAVPQTIEQPTPPAATSQSAEQSSTSAVAFEQAEQQNEPVTPPEEIHSSEGEKKKQKGNSFFSFFRK